MRSPTPKETVMYALMNYRGDDYARAQLAFRGMTDEQMSEQYGESGSTRQQILDGYREHDQQVQAAIDYAKTLP